MVIRAIHENGVLRLLTPLDLPEHIEVEITEVRPVAAETELTDQERMEAVLIAAGIVRPRAPIPPGVRAPTRAELEAVAQRIGAGVSLSAYIIQEREEGW